jgi:hypothetical protein
MQLLLEVIGLGGEAESASNGGGVESSIPAYASGGYVPETGIALLHAGEYVVPASDVETISTGSRGDTYNSYHFDQLVLPNVANYDEFKSALERDYRLSAVRRGVI